MSTFISGNVSKYTLCLETGQAAVFNIKNKVGYLQPSYKFTREAQVLRRLLGRRTGESPFLFAGAVGGAVNKEKLVKL
jgi:hypothetical protein